MLRVIHGYLFLLAAKILDSTQFKHSKHAVLNSSHRRFTNAVCEVFCRKVEENSEAIFLMTAKFALLHRYILRLDNSKFTRTSDFTLTASRSLIPDIA